MQFSEYLHSLWSHSRRTVRSWISCCSFSNRRSNFRINRYTAFKAFEKRILVATDIFGRGIDVERVNIVVNYDCPPDPDSYLHRVGCVFTLSLHSTRDNQFGFYPVVLAVLAQKVLPSLLWLRSPISKSWRQFNLDSRLLFQNYLTISIQPVTVSFQIKVHERKYLPYYSDFVDILVFFVLLLM